MRPVEFEKVKVFLSQVIESLDVGPNATRVGLVNYASSVKQEFPLRAHSSKAELLQAVRDVSNHLSEEFKIEERLERRGKIHHE